MKRMIIFVICIEIILNTVLFSCCFAQDNVYISRSQMASEIIEIYEDITQSYMSVSFSTPPFDDVKNNRTDIEKCYSLDIMQGVGENEFAPDDWITRAQAVVIICRLLNRIDTWNEKGQISHETYEYFEEDALDEEERFSDDADIPLWAKYSVYDMKNKGYIIGDENKMFNPDKYLTKEHIKIVLDKIVNAYRTI